MDVKPAIPVAVDIDTKRALIDPFTGERLQEYEHVYTEYDAGRIRAGYCCVNCGEAQIDRECRRCQRTGVRVIHRGPFPEHCYVCGFPMREQQQQKFASEFEGYTTVGATKSIEQLRLEDTEAKERAKRDRAGVSSSKIWVPRGLRP